MNRLKLLLLFLFALVFSFSVFPASYTVENLPNPKTRDASNFVANPDNILTGSTVSRMNQIINSLEQETGAEIAVVAVNSIGSDDIRDFAVRLFARWGIGKAGADNGLLILFVLDQREIVFETGYGLEGVLPDAIASRIIHQQILPEFRNGNYDAGIVAGVERASSVIREEPVAIQEDNEKNWGVIIPVAVALYIILMLISFLWMWSSVKNIKSNPKHVNNVARYYAVKRQRSSIISVMAIVLPFIGFFFMLFFADYAAYLLFLIPVPFLPVPAAIYGKRQMKAVRNQPIPCESCGGMMRVLSEKEEDAYLSEPQKLEEKLGSVDYDVFKCDECDEIKILRVDKSSVFSVCPNCGTKAYTEDRKQTIKKATYSSTGTERTYYKCRYCGYEDHKDRTLPRLERSTAVVIGGLSGGGRGSGGFGGGGSFGGGRSGGGGARGGW